MHPRPLLLLLLLASCSGSRRDSPAALAHAGSLPLLIVNRQPDAGICSLTLRASDPTDTRVLDVLGDHRLEPGQQTQVMVRPNHYHLTARNCPPSPGHPASATGPVHDIQRLHLTSRPTHVTIGADHPVEVAGYDDLVSLALEKRGDLTCNVGNCPGTLPCCPGQHCTYLKSDHSNQAICVPDAE